MRKILLVGALLLLGACRSAQVAGGATGASSSRDAVRMFMDAARAGDLQMMSAVWGTEQGPVRDRLSHDELEKRQLIMVCHFRSDDYEVVSERAGEKDQRVTRVQLRRGTLRGETTFWTVQGPSDRWYVANADINAVREFCRSGESG